MSTQYATEVLDADVDDGTMPENVGWSSGNPFYYGYGFTISVIEADQ